MDPSRVTQMIGSGAAQLFKLLYWIAVILIVGYLLWRYRGQVLEALRNFLRMLEDIWASLFGRGGDADEEQEAAAAGASEPPGRAFADFADPFVTGDAERWTTNQLVRYSFEAFEAWARERGWPREPEQTPTEFARSIAAKDRTLSRPVLRLADMFNVSAYGQRSVPSDGVITLRQLWNRLREV
jgi:hypothetical protein